jgi:N utilization substance protein B
MSKVDTALFHTILFGVPKNLAQIDGTYSSYLDRENKQLDPVSRAVLRLSSYEMVFSIDVPYKVVINEGVNLAKTYGPTDAYKFINGVLDKVAIEHRAAEVAANKRR